MKNQLVFNKRGTMTIIIYINDTSNIICRFTVAFFIIFRVFYRACPQTVKDEYYLSVFCLFTDKNVFTLNLDNNWRLFGHHRSNERKSLSYFLEISIVHPLIHHGWTITLDATCLSNDLPLVFLHSPFESDCSFRVVFSWWMILKKTKSICKQTKTTHRNVLRRFFGYKTKKKWKMFTGRARTFANTYDGLSTIVME